MRLLREIWAWLRQCEHDWIMTGPMRVPDAASDRIWLRYEFRCERCGLTGALRTVESRS